MYRGFDELGGTDIFTTSHLESLLLSHGLLDPSVSEVDVEGLEEIEELREKHGGINQVSVRMGVREGGVQRQRRGWDDEEDDDLYDDDDL